MSRAGLLLLVCLLLPGTSFAHGLMLYAYAQGGVVYCEAYGDDERPLADGRFEVRDSAQTLLLEGVTGNDGKFNFQIPKIDALVSVFRPGTVTARPFVC